MNIFKSIKEKIVKIIRESCKLDTGSSSALDLITIEISNNQNHGEISTNAAMVISRAIKDKSAQDIATTIVKELKRDQNFQDVLIAGVGFVNMKLKPEYWQQELAEILSSNANYGRSDIGNGARVDLEFASPNPTGPMHIGHVRGAIYGDALSELLKYVGFEVTKEFYVNDFGNQIRLFVRSVHARYLELLGLNKEKFSDEYYPGGYVIDIAKALQDKYGDELQSIEEEKTYELIRKFSVTSMMDLIKHDLKSIGIAHDVYFYESTLHLSGKIESAIAQLKRQNVAYQGTLEKPKDDSSSDWEEREQLLMRTSNYGDAMDRVLQKSNGEWTYFAADIAYLENKLERNFNKLILILGHDHIGYKKRLEAACSALNHGKNILEIKMCQLVMLLRNGKPFKMSKRAGIFVTVSDVLQIVSKDMLRFSMLMRKNDAPLEVDLEKIKEQSKDNPVFYVQYANARASSVLRNADEEAKSSVEKLESGQVNLSLLNDPSELELIKWLSYWPTQIEVAASRYEPHLIVFYLQHVAGLFHAFWNRGKNSAQLRFVIQDNIELTAARLALVKSVSTIITNAFKLIGVTPVTSM